MERSWVQRSVVFQRRPSSSSVKSQPGGEGRLEQRQEQQPQPPVQHQHHQFRERLQHGWQNRKLQQQQQSLQHQQQHEQQPQKHRQQDPPLRRAPSREVSASGSSVASSLSATSNRSHHNHQAGVTSASEAAVAVLSHSDNHDQGYNNIKRRPPVPSSNSSHGSQQGSGNSTTLTAWAVYGRHQSRISAAVDQQRRQEREQDQSQPYKPGALSKPLQRAKELNKSTKEKKRPASDSTKANIADSVRPAWLPPPVVFANFRNSRHSWSTSSLLASRSTSSRQPRSRSMAHVETLKNNSTGNVKFLPTTSTTMELSRQTDNDRNKYTDDTSSDSSPSSVPQELSEATNASPTASNPNPIETAEDEIACDKALFTTSKHDSSVLANTEEEPVSPATSTSKKGLLLLPVSASPETILSTETAMTTTTDESSPRSSSREAAILSEKDNTIGSLLSTPIAATSLQGQVVALKDQASEEEPEVSCIVAVVEAKHNELSKTALPPSESSVISQPDKPGHSVVISQDALTSLARATKQQPVAAVTAATAEPEVLECADMVSDLRTQSKQLVETEHNGLVSKDQRVEETPLDQEQPLNTKEDSAVISKDQQVESLRLDQEDPVNEEQSKAKTRESPTLLQVINVLQSELSRQTSRYKKQMEIKDLKLRVRQAECERLTTRVAQLAYKLHYHQQVQSLSLDPNQHPPAPEIVPNWTLKLADLNDKHTSDDDNEDEDIDGSNSVDDDFDEEEHPGHGKSKAPSNTLTNNSVHSYPRAQQKSKVRQRAAVIERQLSTSNHSEDGDKMLLNGSNHSSSDKVNSLRASKRLLEQQQSRGGGGGGCSSSSSIMQVSHPSMYWQQRLSNLRAELEQERAKNAALQRELMEHTSNNNTNNSSNCASPRPNADSQLGNNEGVKPPQEIDQVPSPNTLSPETDHDPMWKWHERMNALLLQVEQAARALQDELQQNHEVDESVTGIQQPVPISSSAFRVARSQLMHCLQQLLGRLLDIDKLLYTLDRDNPETDPCTMLASTAVGGQYLLLSSSNNNNIKSLTPTEQPQELSGLNAIGDSDVMDRINVAGVNSDPTVSEATSPERTTLYMAAAASTTTQFQQDSMHVRPVQEGCDIKDPIRHNGDNDQKIKLAQVRREQTERVARAMALSMKK